MQKAAPFLARQFHGQGCDTAFEFVLNTPGFTVSVKRRGSSKSSESDEDKVSQMSCL